MSAVSFINNHKQLSNSFLEFLNKNEFALKIIEALRNDETLCPLFRKDKIDVYYRGYKCFVLSGNNGGKVVFQSGFDNKFDIYFKAVQYTLSFNSYGELQDFMMCFHEILAINKQKMDFWFKGKKSPYEREFTQLILRENNSKKFGNETDFFIVDMEYTYYEKSNGGQKKSSPDLIAFAWSRQKRRYKKHRLAIIEVKYMDKALTGKAGIISHIDDYVSLLSNKNLLDDIKEDIAVEYKQKVNLSMVQGDKSSGDIKWSPGQPILILALIGHNTNSSILKTELGKIEPLLEEKFNDEQKRKEILDNIFVINTSEIGFGLYEDKLINIDNYLKLLK